MNIPTIELRKISNAIAVKISPKSSPVFQTKFSLTIIALFNIGLAAFYLEMLTHRMEVNQPEVGVTLGCGYYLRVVKSRNISFSFSLSLSPETHGNCVPHL